MMSSLSNHEATAVRPMPISPFDYRDIAAPPSLPPSKEPSPENCNQAQEEEKKKPAGPTPEQIEQMVRVARAEGAAEAEKRLRKEYEAKLVAESASMRGAVQNAIEGFSVERKQYYARVESDIVQLALSITQKILHRESQVDPLMLMSLVRVSLEKMQDAAKAIVRVAPLNAEKWRKHFAAQINGLEITVVEDENLNLEDCVLETDIGSANFGLDAQLKEVESGFFDLLAQRPS